MNWKTKWLSASMPSCTARAALALFAVLASSMLRRCSSSASLASMRYAVCLPKQRMQSGGPAQNAQSSSEFFAILEWRERDSQTSCEKVDIERINEWMNALLSLTFIAFRFQMINSISTYHTTWSCNTMRAWTALFSKSRTMPLALIGTLGIAAAPWQHAQCNCQRVMNWFLMC